ncbi:hypothetical protein I3W98_33390 [Streptomyces cavourensis]|nr:hypothetical protein [Streptomyces cavourensis]
MSGQQPVQFDADDAVAGVAAASARSVLPCVSNCSTSDELPNCSTSRETSTIVASARSTPASWARSTRARASSSDLVNRTPAERLLRSYHTEGLDIASHEVLEKLGVKARLAPSAVRRMLEGTEFTEDVRADERRRGSAASGACPRWSRTAGRRPRQVDRETGRTGER